MMTPVPAEWSPHAAMWVGFPSHEELWQEDLADAQREVAQLAHALAGPGRERVKLMVANEEALATALDLIGATPGVEIVLEAFGDVWLRDTGPIFTAPGQGAGFRFNGWGEKYDMPGDDTVAERLAARAGASLIRHDFVLEGGSLDHDGKGTILTTRQCLLNPNRNTGWREGDAERALEVALGARKIIWLDQGLMNDHTDGHVDNLARFVAPGVVACPVAFGADDPNAAVYDKVAETLAAATDADGQHLRVARIPSPGRVTDDDHHVVPASHMNFLIANGAVVVPTYGDPAGDWAVQALEGLFPDRTVIGVAAHALLTGGGSFHCISQQEIA